MVQGFSRTKEEALLPFISFGEVRDPKSYDDVLTGIEGASPTHNLFGKAPAQSCSRGQIAVAEALGSYAPPDPGSVTTTVRKLKRGEDTP